MKIFVGRILVVCWVVLLLWAGLAVAGERMAVSVSTANVRRGPGTDNAVLWRVEKYYPVDVLDKQGEWYRFKDFEGDEGWLHNSLLDATETVVIKKDECNVRSGPGTDYEIVFTVHRGVPFKVIGRRGDWLHIRHADGDTGWVYQALIW